MIRLNAAGGDQRVAAFGDGICREEFELPCLVAPQSQPGLVVALDEDARSAEERAGLKKQADDLIDKVKEIKQKRAEAPQQPS